MAFARMPDELQQLNPVALQELAERAGEGPVVMLSLIDLKPEGGRERYAEYGAAVRPLLERAGGSVIYAGSGTAALIGPSKWDLVLLVEYPTRQAFLDMVSSPEFLEIADLRTGALERSELHPLDPADVDGVV
jgi:uncharacterized protein (DUF1330 family)